MRDLLELYGKARASSIREHRRGQAMQELQVLRTKTSKLKGAPIWSVAATAISQGLGYFMLILAPPAAKQSMCKFYGHLVDHDKWQANRMPKCSECGAKISGPSDLRRAIA